MFESGNVKILIFLFGVIFLALPVVAGNLPFGFKYGMNPTEIDYEIIKPAKRVPPESIGNVTFDFDSRDYDYVKNEQAMRVNELCHLKNTYGVNLDPSNTMISLLLIMLKSTSFDKLKTLKTVKQQDAYIKLLRGAGYRPVHPDHNYLINVLERLFKTDEFKSFVEFQIPEDSKVIIYNIDGNSTCTQFINNELAQVSLTWQGYKKLFWKIRDTIREKYNFEPKTYRITSPDKYKVSYCTSSYAEEDYKKDCFLDQGNIDVDGLGNISMLYPNPSFKKAFFQRYTDHLDDLNNNKDAYITYSEPSMIQRYNDNIEGAQIEYNSNIFSPLLDMFERLSVEEKGKEDPYLEQF